MVLCAWYWDDFNSLVEEVPLKDIPLIPLSRCGRIPPSLQQQRATIPAHDPARQQIYMIRKLGAHKRTADPKKNSTKIAGSFKNRSRAATYSALAGIVGFCPLDI
jgi:hypothetical protein